MGAWIETKEGVKLTYADKSHPVWVRGLKPSRLQRPAACKIESHPVWVRGLKHLFSVHSNYIGYVAPRVGAWIETGSSTSSPSPATAAVAPRVGAWIETIEASKYILIHPSHPVWVRGLKQDTERNETQYRSVSHPVWVRGLNHIESASSKYEWVVAPRVGAWIETAFPFS